MNIFKKISLANKAIKAFKTVNDYLKSNHIPDEVKGVIQDLERDFKRLTALFPVLKTTYEEILKALKNE